MMNLKLCESGGVRIDSHRRLDGNNLSHHSFSFDAFQFSFKAFVVL
ncbi:MAG: hypothetical protein KME08_11535 [Aphanothece sp. CMT-3BRIN-NPC111]|nr:hypothetical protein [Aphanothece sp. CMT-3BRIN-NPC111]